MSRANTSVKLMGIVNVTPDSFFDGGCFLTASAAYTHGMRLIEEGANILDIGGESTRPGAKEVSVQEEMDRVVPVIESLAQNTTTPLSIDTRKSKVAQAAIKAGARVWNDVSALSFDADSLALAAQLQVDTILMHTQGTPDKMQQNPSYTNIVQDVMSYLQQRANAARAAGLAAEKIILDPGIGFGKNIHHNLALLANLGTFVQELEYPILLGASRKSFIENIDPHKEEKDRLGGSLATAIFALTKGVSWLRVHDVAQTRQAIRVFQAINTF